MATSNALAINILLSTYMLIQCFLYFPAKHTELRRGKENIEYAVREAAPCPIYLPRGRASAPQGLHHETSLEATACALARTRGRYASIFCLLVSYKTLSNYRPRFDGLTRLQI